MPENTQSTTLCLAQITVHEKLVIIHRNAPVLSVSKYNTPPCKSTSINERLRCSTSGKGFVDAIRQPKKVVIISLVKRTKRQKTGIIPLVMQPIQHYKDVYGRQHDQLHD